MGSLLLIATALLHHSPAGSQAADGEPDAVRVERDGTMVATLPAERTVLEYPELSGRPEANAALDPSGTLWAAIGYSVGDRHRNPGGRKRLFCSRDGGQTWTSRLLPMPADTDLLAFTTLADGALVLVTTAGHDDPAWRKVVRVFRSEDRGQTWQTASEVGPDPFEQVGEGFLSITQLADGTLLLPIARWTDRGDQRELLHAVLASHDGGRTFPASYPTFPDCHEAHVVQLRSGRLLAAFRYQRPVRAGDTAESLRALGGEPEWTHPTTGARATSIFKHVWIGASDDGGRTWRDFGPARDSLGRPLLRFGEAHGQLVQAADGRVVLVHDCRYPYERAETRAHVSSDDGRTWAPEIYHVAKGMGYASSVALADGTIVTVTGSTQVDASFRAMGKWEAVVVRWRLP